MPPAHRWTLGILIYEMLVGQPPFCAESQIDTYHKIMRGRYKVPQGMSSRDKDVISKLLCHNPNARLGCGKVSHRRIARYFLTCYLAT